MIPGVTSDIDYENNDQMSVFPSYEDSMRRLDVEDFIYKLNMKETITILFMAMSYKPKEISDILGYKNVNNVYQILYRIRNLKSTKEEF